MPDPVPIRPDGLQLNENRGFQEWFWTAQRIVWGLFLLLALITATGVSGRGGTVAQGEAFIGTAQITWPRITRRGVPETLTVRLPATSETPEFTLGGNFQSLFQIEGITPRPAMESGGDPLRLAFFPERGNPHSLRLSVRSQKAGLIHYEIAIGPRRLTLSTLVLP